MRLRILAGVLAGFVPALATAQLPEYGRLLAQARAIAATETSPPPLAPEKPDPTWRNVGLIGGFTAGVALYGSQKWWSDGLTSHFRSESEGWFGKDTPYGGVDKLGHLYTTYASARILTPVFEWMGNDAKASRTLATWTAFGVMAGVEIVDGFSKQYKFSREDFIANGVGAVFAYVMEAQPGFDKLVDFRIAYKQSTHSSDWDPFGDYSGQRYLLVAKADALPALRDNPLTRYLEVSVGYGTRGYDASQGVSATRSRDVYFGISLNLARVLADGFYGGTMSTTRTQRNTERFLDLVQLPVAAYARKELDQ
ncbi:DUF2279 domain-containing protein [Usitatibacter palustris]|uniref:DUF2279 domain-containing protein n=1 Tax=Usitatibacter palustris TaxID=2732487 RepID=A0A6M4H2Z2_9PROT|nr:DUF2279 domain-containing protein [Usitatibacter palustris]QJR13810.1 hypothetical protein DSM104440_00600 [Usitatibacter palustris]